LLSNPLSAQFGRFPPRRRFELHPQALPDLPDKFGFIADNSCSLPPAPRAMGFTSKATQAMIKIRFQAAGMNASQVVVPKDIDSPIPFRVDDRVEHLNSGPAHHLVVVSARYVVDEPNGAFYQMVSVAAHAL
jgi:hypothetical protein